MKSIVSYSLLILVLYAFSYKTISYCIQSFDKSIELSQDYDCEKEDAQSEKSSEKSDKNEVKDFPEYLFSHKSQLHIAAYQLSVTMRHDLLFATSDYSMSVYFPPEQA